MAEAKYVGNGKKHPKFDGCLSFGFSKDNLEVLQKSLNDKGWVNVIISPTRDDPEKYYAKIDDWKPNR
jgi:hypothetical protein